MVATIENVKSLIERTPRVAAASVQDSMPSQYPRTIQLLSMTAFTVAFFGWLNESWLFLFDNPVWLNRYTEYALICGFGIWRITAERNAYTRKRLIVLVAMVTVVWWLVPWLAPFFEPYVGFVWMQPVFPSLHIPGTVSFFLVLAAVFLFGRRVICGWNCPCVGIRETVGYPFRDRTVRGRWAWRLRHSKWIFFIYYVGVMIVTQYPPNTWTVNFVGGFYLIVGLTYFGTFFIAPLVGNRFYCRYLCPYGATFGLLNHAGFYCIRMDQGKCNDCRRCEQVCDMGIPVWGQGKAHGRVTGIEDCMGCARCVMSCPTDSLEIRDVRNLFKPTLVQNGSHLMKKAAPDTLTPRREPEMRPATLRVSDCHEIYITPPLAHMQEQAARCLDCGVPGCVNACPLHNRIPEWLEAVAKGEIETAARIAHATSPLPEVCGRLCPQHRLCEGACTRAQEGKGAVTIGAIERYLTDTALAQGWRPSLVAEQRIAKRVAVVGAGPAGLACAERLISAGCAVAVYDRHAVVGGLLATGTPPFKLDKAVLEQRHALLEQAGVVFHLGVEAGSHLMADLIDEHDAVFLGTGAQMPRCVELPGRTLPGVHQALDYLAAVNTGRPTQLVGRHVLVLGGGDTAMDCVRSAVRGHAASVTVAQRRTEDEMRASLREVKAARDEGVHLLFNHCPVAIIGAEHVNRVQFYVNGEERSLPCDAVILAFGFMPNAPDWLAHFGIATDDRGCIKVDAQGRTTHPKVYAGGDNSHGPDLVVTAMAAGRRAAEAMLHSFRLRQRTIATVANLLTRESEVSQISAAAAFHETGTLQ